MRLRVTIAAPAALMWLERGGSWRVLNVFDRVVNLLDESGEVLSLVRSAGLLGPFAAVVADLDPRAWTRLGGQQTAVPRADIGRAIAWNPSPAWHLLRRAEWPAAAFAAGEVGASFGSLASDAQREQLSDLAKALTAGDSGRAAASAARLAGWGEGLTPAGDDFMVGAMHALWARRDPAEAAALSQGVAAAAAPRTTILSAAWLRAAARGEASAPWHALVAALATPGRGPEPELAAARRGILASGASSGAAALAGFGAVFAASVGGGH